jgi:hypothetical protein
MKTTAEHKPWLLSSMPPRVRTPVAILRVEKTQRIAKRRQRGLPKEDKESERDRNGPVTVAFLLAVRLLPCCSLAHSFWESGARVPSFSQPEGFLLAVRLLPSCSRSPYFLRSCRRRRTSRGRACAPAAACEPKPRDTVWSPRPSDTILDYPDLESEVQANAGQRGGHRPIKHGNILTINFTTRAAGRSQVKSLH